MKTTRYWISLVMILALALTSGVSAQTGGETFSPEEQVLIAPVLGSALLGYDVIGENGNGIGNIGGLVIDSSTNQVHYLSIDTDDLFDADRLVPWSAFQLVANNEIVDGDDLIDPVPAYDPLAFTLFLPIDEEVFDETAPELDETLLGDFETLTPGWDDEIGGYWSDYNEAIPATGLGDEVNPNDLFFVSGGLFAGIDFNVYNFNDELLGEVEDYIINPDGSVPFALLEMDDLFNFGDDMVVVSMPALRWDADDEVFFLNIDEEVLESAPRFDPLLIPDFRTPGWETEWNTFWVANIDNIGDAGDTGVDDAEMTGRMLRDALFGAQVVDAEDQVLGTVGALIFRGENQLRYVVVENADTGEFHTVPWGFFNYDADTSQLTFNGEPGALVDSPAFQSLNDINVSDPDWDADVETYWSDQEATAMITPLEDGDEALNPSVMVEDQTIDNGTVTVPEVVSAGPGWMVIHADDNGSPGAVIGFTEVADGVNQDVSVEIDSAMATETLYAMLHSDTGSVGEYEFPGGDPPARVNGQVVIQPFMATGGMETGEMQPVTPGEEAMTMTVVDMVGTEFDPANISVPVGTEVTWSNESDLPHTVTADDGLFDSDIMRIGAEFSYTFDEPGEYPYYCALHGGPGGQGMSGVVTVTEE